ncbi:MAG: DUF5011 domain-containing protein [Bacteroidia bacterium]|jgi:trimeric autotransporter adhesin|nr:DUF5011 domain-containing protein [Bacteroidia bacterium]
MKKQVFALAAVAMIAGTLTFTSCAKEDTVAPVITVTGGNSFTQNLPAIFGQGTWTNPTVTATDDEDGEITSINVSGTVDPDLAGTYTLTYTCSDAAGNMATETVTVNIVNEAQFLAGTYDADSDTCQQSTVIDYDGDVNVSTTVNNAVSFNDFGGFGNNVNLAGTRGNGTITVNAQAIDGTSNLLSCTMTYSTTPSTIINYNYTWADAQSNIESCSSIWIKQ